MITLLDKIVSSLYDNWDEKTDRQKEYANGAYNAIMHSNMSISKLSEELGEEEK
ncbi:MAG: hypothetical protein M0R51_15125 [Clostridia bacterium]|jgi:hypothetical protein|nr:hypothetical protein [Clostridia bacterium]